MFSIGDKNIATETPLRERDQKNALLETGRIEQMNRKIKPDGQKSKAVPPPARSLAPAHAAPWRLLFALLVWGWGGGTVLTFSLSFLVTQILVKPIVKSFCLLAHYLVSIILCC